MSDLQGRMRSEEIDDAAAVESFGNEARDVAQHARIVEGAREDTGELGDERELTLATDGV
jgi:hypothetical protein